MATRISHAHSPIQKRAGYLSLIIAIILLIVKSTAFLITGSAAILSDALESVLHIIPTMVVIFSLRLTSKPADSKHHYGHGKIEYISAGIEATAIFAAAIAIIYESIQRFSHHEIIPNLQGGFWLLVLALVVNFFLARYLIAQGIRTHSLILESNGRHILTDVWTSAGVAVGLIIVMATKTYILDPIIAMLVALQIIVTAVRLYRRSFSGIMDESLEKDDLVIRTALDNHLIKTICSYHRLRHRRSGSTIIIDFHVRYPKHYALDYTHELVTDLEKEIAEHFENVVVISHIEPCEDSDCTLCHSLNCVDS